MSGALLLPLVPAAAAGVGALPPVRRSPRAVSATAVGGAALLLGVALVLLPSALHDPGRVRVDRWLVAPAGALVVRAGTRWDSLAAVVAVMVALVGLGVQAYSVGYLREDPRRRPTYAALVSLFLAAMLLVVVASDLLELLVGWEVMGLCSALLIGHYRELDHARDAAVKAFLVTRAGDLGLLLAIAVLATSAGTTDIGGVLAAVPHLGAATRLAVVLLLLLGVCGKSAQVPLHVWLPDAMAGPTPVSALIHAATMVAAGGYLVARLHPLVLSSRGGLDALAVVAAVTTVLAALAALAQDDLKRLLAWSTASQLATMLAGLAAGGYDAGLLHLLVHAAAKATLFLAAGVVLHAAHTGALAELRGVARRMPAAALGLVVGGATLAGVPPLGGAWSKDAVTGALERALREGGAGTPHRWASALALLAVLATVVLTAAYVTRLLVVLLLPGRADTAATLHATEPLLSAVVVAGAVVALLTALLPLPGLLPAALPAPAGAARGLEVTPLGVVVAVLLLALGAGLTWRASQRGAQDPVAALGRWRAPLREGLGFDAAYRRLLVRPALAAGGSVDEADARGLQPLVQGLAHAVGVAGQRLPLGRRARVRGYLTATAGGAVLLVLLAVVVVVSAPGPVGR